MPDPTIPSFTPGEVLTAADLNQGFAAVTPAAGADLTPTASWSGVPAVVQAGAAAPNAALQALANRTETLNPDSQGPAGTFTGAESWVVKRAGSWFKGTPSAFGTWVLTLLALVWTVGPGAVARTLWALINDLPVSVKNFGARGDGVVLSDGAITAATTAFTSASAAFTSADVGKAIVVPGAGVSGAVLSTTIAGFVSANAVTLAASASTTVTGAPTTYGTVDTAAINSAFSVGAAEVMLPPGNYLVDATIPLPATLKRILASQNTTITRIVDVPIYSKAGNLTGSAIAVTNSPLTGDTFVSVGAGTYGALNPDDWIYLRGANHTPNVTAGSAVACLRKIVSISTVANNIYFDAALYRDQGSGATVRLYKAQLAPRVTLSGGSYTSALNQTDFMALFDFQLCFEPIFDSVEYGGAGGPGLALAHCVGGAYINSHVHDLRDDITNGHAGYGVALRGATRGYVFGSGSATKVRHAITTLTVTPGSSYLPTDPAYPDLQATGEPEACHYGPVYVYDTTSVGLDTHEQGFGITITPNVHGCFDGVELRCSDASVMGGQIVNCRRAGIRVEFPASNPTATVVMNHNIRGTSVYNVGVQGTQSYGILADAAGATINVSDINVKGFQSAGIATTAAGIAVNMVGGVVDGGVRASQDGLQFFDGSSSVHETLIKNCNNGVNNLNGANELRHVRFSGNNTNITPASTIDYLNYHTIPLDYFISGRYYAAGGQGATSTSSTLGNGSFRASPFVVHAPVTLASIGAEITAAGSAGALLRLGIYADAGGYPGNLVVDAGTIDGTSATPQELAISVTLQPGLYWLGGAVQGAPSTQPTVRTIGNGLQTVGATSLSAATSAGTVGFATTATGALPATFVAGSNANGTCPRVVVKVA